MRGRIPYSWPSCLWCLYQLTQLTDQMKPVSCESPVYKVCSSNHQIFQETPKKRILPLCYPNSQNNPLCPVYLKCPALASLAFHKRNQNRFKPTPHSSCTALHVSASLWSTLGDLYLEHLPRGLCGRNGIPIYTKIAQHPYRIIAVVAWSKSPSCSLWVCEFVTTFFFSPLSRDVPAGAIIQETTFFVI